MRDQQLSELMCLQDVAINLLATGYTIEEVAEVLGLAARTIERWRYADPSFKRTLKNLSTQLDP